MKIDLTQTQHLIFGIILFQTLWNNSGTMMTGSIFQRIGGAQLSNSYATILTRSCGQCVYMCHQGNQSACVAVSYTNVTRNCKLSDKWINIPTVQANEDISWDIYFDRGQKFCQPRRENSLCLSSGFPTWKYTNRSAQLQSIARVFQFRLLKSQKHLRTNVTVTVTPNLHLTYIWGK